MVKSHLAPTFRSALHFAVPSRCLVPPLGFHVSDLSLGTFSLLPASEDRGYGARAAPSVHYRDNPQGLFLRCVGDQVFTYKNEAQRPRTEIRASVAPMGKNHKPADGVKNLR
jgi:hypothetical protein